MARLFRLWEKKRGERRTGSKTAGGVGEALFFAALFLLGAVSLTALLTSMFASGSWLSGWWLWLVVVVLASFALIGGGGFVYSLLHLSASAERRSAIMRRATDLEVLGDEAKTAAAFPNVPLDPDLTNSPGTTLTYRLPVVQTPVWRVATMGVFCAAWNTVAAVLVVLVSQGFATDRPDWLLTALVLPVVAVGGWTIYYFVQQLLEHAGVGPTSVEISELPLRPGGSYEVFLSQAGQMTVESLEMLLVCDEDATFSQGTDVRSETRRVHCQQVFGDESLSVDSRTPLQRRCQLQIPAAAMHSFQSPHNSVHWKLVVRGRPSRRPAFQRVFPIVVFPPS